MSLPAVTLSRFEHIADISLSALNTSYQLPTRGGQLPSERWIERLRFEFEGRFANPATGGPTGVLADAPYSIIDGVTVEGIHKIRGTTERFIDVRMADLRELHRIYTLHDPLSTPATLSVTASANNDVRFIVDLPFIPLRVNPRQQVNYLLDAPNYDGLVLTVRYADMNSVFSGQTTQPTVTAFGVATGSPRLRVAARYAQQGPGRWAGMIPARVFRNYVELSGSDMTTTATGVRVFQLPRGWKLRGCLIKTGVFHTSATSGNNPYSTLSDSIFANVKVLRGLGNQQRFWSDYHNLKEEAGSDFGVRPNTGYALIDFAGHGDLSEAYDTRSMISGPDGNTDFHLAGDVTGAANQRATFLTEELRYEPGRLTPSGGR